MDKFVEIASGPMYILLGVTTFLNNSYPLWASVLFIIIGVAMSVLVIRRYLKSKAT